METAVIGRLLVEQKDRSGHVEPCIARTEWGKIPAKCKGNLCWFPYGGNEYVTDNFKRIIGTFDRPIALVDNNSSGVPPHAIKGKQNDGAGIVYAAIAKTQWGLIPGKVQDGECWFPYNGQEHSTPYFSWIVRVHIQ